MPVAFADKMADLEQYCMVGTNAHKPGPCPGPYESEGSDGLSREEIEDLLNRVKDPKVGGFTYDPILHKQVQDGFSVSIYPEHETALDPSTVTEEGFRDFIGQHFDRVKEADPEAQFGGWFFTEKNKIVLDVVRVVHNKEEAVNLGNKFKQVGIYDLRRKEYIELNPGESGRFSEAYSLCLRARGYKRGDSGSNGGVGQKAWDKIQRFLAVCHESNERAERAAATESDDTSKRFSESPATIH